MFAELASEVPEIPATDAAVVESCRGGDRAAWQRLYEAHFELAYRTARRLGTPDAEVEDAVHEVFEVVLKRLDTFREGQFSTWLYRIVANVVSSRLRRRRLRSFLDGLWGQRGEREMVSLESMVSARQQLERVGEVLRSLSDAHREVFALHEIEGLSHEEISRLTGVKVATVRSRLHYAKRDFERLAQKRGLS